MANFAHAWLGWRNLFEEFASTITASSEVSGFPALFLGNWFTYQRWKGVDGANGNTWWNKIDCGTPRAANYVCIGGHTLDGHQIEVQGSNDDSTWTTVFVVTPDATTLYEYNGVTLYDGSQLYDGTIEYAGAAEYGPNHMSGRFPQVAYRYWRVWYGAGPTTAPQVSVLALGVATEFPTGFYGGFPRPNWNQDVETTNSISERGVFLGRSVIRTGLRPFKINLSYLPHDWMLQEWQPFKAHAEKKPFFFVWEPNGLDTVNGTRNNTDCVYAWGRLEASTLKDKRYANASISCEGSLQ